MLLIFAHHSNIVLHNIILIPIKHILFDPTLLRINELGHALWSWHAIVKQLVAIVYEQRVTIDRIVFSIGIIAVVYRLSHVIFLCFEYLLMSEGRIA